VRRVSPGPTWVVPIHSPSFSLALIKRRVPSDVMRCDLRGSVRKFAQEVIGPKVTQMDESEVMDPVSILPLHALRGL